MGIKDLFRGGKGKEKFREEAKEAAKGKLGPGKAEEIAAIARDHGIEDLADDKTMMRRSIYNKAVAGAKARGKLSVAEAAELAKIQKFLALRDDQVERTRWDLTRLRTLTEIRQGRLPTVAAANVALRGVPLGPGEIAHYCVPVEVLDRPSTGGLPGVPVRWAAAYAINSAKGHSVPADGAKTLGDGHLILTSKRLFLRNPGKSAAVEYSPQANLFIYGDGLRIERTVGHTILRFKSQSDGTAEIVGELLSALMR
jgi:hypothetical protein